MRELEQYGEIVDVKPFVREYIECLARIHDLGARLMADDLAQATMTFEATVHDLEAQMEERISSVTIVQVRESGTEVDRGTLFGDLIARRHSLERRRGHATQLARHYVSGRVRVDGV